MVKNYTGHRDKRKNKTVIEKSCGNCGSRRAFNLINSGKTKCTKCGKYV